MNKFQKGDIIFFKNEHKDCGILKGATGIIVAPKYSGIYSIRLDVACKMFGSSYFDIDVGEQIIELAVVFKTDKSVPRSLIAPGNAENLWKECVG